MNDFNADADNLKLYYWVAIVSLIVLTFLFWGSIALVLIPLYIGLLLLRPWQYTISKAHSINQHLKVTKYNWLLGSKSYSFDLAKIDFTYRTRPVKLVKNALPNIPNTGDVLMVFYDKRLLFDLTPDEGGWTETSIRQFARELKADGVKQIREKYGTNDVIDY